MLENSLVGVLLSVFVSIISPFLKDNPNRNLWKMGIILFVSIILAVCKKYLGEDFKQSFIDIIGSASVFYSFILRTLDDPIERFSGQYINK